MDVVRKITTKEQKLIRSLAHKKYRDSQGLFVAEGWKVIEPLMPFFRLELFASICPNDIISPDKQRTVTQEELIKLSGLTNPAGEIAVFKTPDYTANNIKDLSLAVALDAIQNPGNMGTIIRLCDWLGIRALVLGEGSADPFSPKVVQATAGALGGITLIGPTHLPDFIRGQHFDRVIGTALDGKPVSEYISLHGNGRTLVIFGNEGHGLSHELKDLCSDLILIPSAKTTISESLNVSISAAILLSRLCGL